METWTEKAAIVNTSPPSTTPFAELLMEWLLLVGIVIVLVAGQRALVTAKSSIWSSVSVFFRDKLSHWSQDRLTETDWVIVGKFQHPLQSGADTIDGLCKEFVLWSFICRCEDQYRGVPGNKSFWRTCEARALYVIKSAGAAFRSNLAKYMESLGYESCKADPNLWFKAEIRPEGAVKYYSCLLCYFDDILYIHHNGDAMLEWLCKSFPLKPGFGNSNMYLGVKLHKTRLHNGVWAWEMSSFKYVQDAVRANYHGKYRLPRVGY